jgi:hypothetical protein
MQQQTDNFDQEAHASYFLDNKDEMFKVLFTENPALKASIDEEISKGLFYGPSTASAYEKVHEMVDEKWNSLSDAERVAVKEKVISSRKSNSFEEHLQKAVTETSNNSNSATVDVKAKKSSSDAPAFDDS